jgi:hypothetical protein
MTTMQDKFFRELDALVAETTRNEQRNRREAQRAQRLLGAAGDPASALEVVVSYNAGNCGAAYLQRVGEFVPLSVFTFDFQHGYARFVINGDRFHAVYGTREHTTTAVTLAEVIDAIVHPVRQDPA